MSKRRQPGEVVKRMPGSGFLMDAEPSLVMVPYQPKYETEAAPCLCGCGDSECREWANLAVVGGEFDGQYLYHISECQMQDNL